MKISLISILFLLTFTSLHAFDLSDVEDVVFKPQYKGGSRYGTAFFISPDGHFLATNHGFEVCKNNSVEAGFHPDGLKCPTYEGKYQDRRYDFSIIAYPSFKKDIGLTLVSSFRRKDFLLGKLHLAPGEEVPYVDLTEETPEFKYQDGRKIAGVTINIFRTGVKNVIMPGFSAGKLVTVNTKLIGKHYDRGYLLFIGNNPELKGGASGSPVFDEDGNFFGLLVAKGDKQGVVLAKEKIIEGLAEIDPYVEEFLFGDYL